MAGPGRAFGYEGLIDGGPSPLTAISRERALLLVLSEESFHRLFHEETDVSHVFLDVIQPKPHRVAAAGSAPAGPPRGQRLADTRPGRVVTGTSA